MSDETDTLLHDATGIPIDMSTSSYRTSIGHRSLEEAASAEEAAVLRARRRARQERDPLR